MSPTRRRPEGSTRAPDRAGALRDLRVLVHHLRRSARAIEQRTGITNAQLFLLRTLARAGAQSVNVLAEQARTDQSTVSIVIQRLERAGLVRKARASEDRRRVLVSLTPLGAALVRRAPVPPTVTLLSALDRLSPADARALARGVRALVRALRPAPEEPPLLFEDRGRAPRPARRS
jgi:DNA-binding MarR family transcriptional regulator